MIESRPIPMPSQAVIAKCPGDPAEALAYLREAGCSPVQTILVLRQRLGMDTSDAKLALHASPAWRDVAEAQDRMWDAVEAALEAGEA